MDEFQGSLSRMRIELRKAALMLVDSNRKYPATVAYLVRQFFLLIQVALGARAPDTFHD